MDQGFQAEYFFGHESMYRLAEKTFVIFPREKDWLECMVSAIVVLIMDVMTALFFMF